MHWEHAAVGGAGEDDEAGSVTQPRKIHGRPVRERERVSYLVLIPFVEAVGRDHHPAVLQGISEQRLFHGSFRAGIDDQAAVFEPEAELQALRGVGCQHCRRIRRADVFILEAEGTTHGDSSHLMYGVRHNAPDVHVLPVGDVDLRIVRVLRGKENLAALAEKALHRQFPVNGGDDDPVVFCGQRAVNDEKITVKNAGFTNHSMGNPSKRYP